MIRMYVPGTYIHMHSHKKADLGIVVDVDKYTPSAMHAPSAVIILDALILSPSLCLCACIAEDQR